MFRRKNYFNSVVKSLSSVSTPATLIVPAGWDFWTGQVRPDTWHQNSKSSSIGVQSRFTRISHPFSRHPPSFRKIVTDAISSRNGLFDAFVMLPHSPPEPDFYNPKKTKARLVCAERKYGPWCFQALYTATKIEAGFFYIGPDCSGSGSIRAIFSADPRQISIVNYRARNTWGTRFSYWLGDESGKASA